MYVNKCIKCGAEFETKNPKRVICPSCLYADKSNESADEKPMQSYSSYSSYSTESRPRSYDRTQQNGYRANSYSRDNQDNNYQRRDNYSHENGYSRESRPGTFQRRDNNRSNGYQRRNDGNHRGGFRNNYASARPQQNQRRPIQKRQQKVSKPLLISKEQLEQIELIYKTMLPLPNPDCHEVIGGKLGIEPQKVFFGINLVRQKMMLPKLPFPKRKLAISPDQMTAIKALYEPLLPLPPIGCHKIIAAQLKMDEWRVHVGIKLIRAQLGLDRWNEDRSDKPSDYMTIKHLKTTTEEIIDNVTSGNEEKQELADERNLAKALSESEPAKNNRESKDKDGKE